MRRPWQLCQVPASMTVRTEGLGAHGINQEDVDRIIAENSTAEFFKLEGVPGYRLETTPWQEACRLVKCGTWECLGALGRHPSDIVVYRQFKGKVSALVWLPSASHTEKTSARVGAAPSPPQQPMAHRCKKSMQVWLTMSQQPY